MIAPRETRGYLNNNPGNMDRSEPPWLGEVRDVGACTNDVQRRELTTGRFCVFDDPRHGVRALAKNLFAYKAAFGCKTARDYINHWAPPNENDTEAYIARVEAAVGSGEIDIHRRVVLVAIITAIIEVECAGNPYLGLGVIDAGVSLTGLTHD